jgi:peptide/nickel transport system permease protein
MKTTAWRVYGTEVASRAAAEGEASHPIEGPAMKRFVLRRLGYSLLSLVLLSITIFLLVRVTGDPAVLLVEPGASKADLEAVRAQLGLDRPLVVQYWTFMSSLFKGEFGRSFY